MPRGIRELLEHINRRGLFVAIDTNGTRLPEFADDLVRLGHVHIILRGLSRLLPGSNFKQSTLAELWNSARARSRRERRRKKPFAACNRCVAKFMAVDRSNVEAAS